MSSVGIWICKLRSFLNRDSTRAPVGMVTGPHHIFWLPPQPYCIQGWQSMPSIYWCPHQVLKATGAPDYSNNWRKIYRKDCFIKNRSRYSKDQLLLVSSFSPKPANFLSFKNYLIRNFFWFDLFLEFRAEIQKKTFVGILVKTMTPKANFKKN